MHNIGLKFRVIVAFIKTLKFEASLYNIIKKKLFICNLKLGTNIFSFLYNFMINIYYILSVNLQSPNSKIPSLVSMLIVNLIVIYNRLSLKHNAMTHKRQ